MLILRYLSEVLKLSATGLDIVFTIIQWKKDK